VSSSVKEAIAYAGYKRCEKQQANETEGIHRARLSEKGGQGRSVALFYLGLALGLLR
jgi:hypothetical protein